MEDKQKIQPSIDYVYARDLVERINSLEIEGKNIAEYFIYDGYDWWQTYQQSFFTEAKIFSKTKEFVKRKRTVHVVLQNALIFCIAIVWTLCSLVFHSVFRKKVLVYSIDVTNGSWKNDRRLESLYKHLHSKKVSYLEVFHRVFTKKMFVTLWQRKRFSLYEAALDPVFELIGKLFPSKESRMQKKILSKIDLVHFTEEEQKFVQYLIYTTSNSYSLVRSKVYFFTFALRLLGTKKVVAIDDVRHYNELIAATKRLSIPFTALQHGHFTKYHIGWLSFSKGSSKKIHPDRFIVWSDFWKKELERLGTYISHNTIIPASFGEEVSGIIDVAGSDKITVLIPYETDAPKQELIDAIQLMLSDNVYILFKVRTDVSVEMQCAEYGISANTEEVEIVRQLDTKVLERTSVVLGTYSTFLYEMVEKGIPVALLETGLDYGYGMVVNNLAELVSIQDSFVEHLQKVALLSKEERRERQKKLLSDSKSLHILLDDIL